MAEAKFNKIQINGTTYLVVPDSLASGGFTASLPVLSSNTTLATVLDLQGIKQLPEGGNAGQVLSKTEGGYAWVDQTGGSGGSGTMTKEQILKTLGITDADLQMAMKIAAATQSVSGNNVVMKGQLDAASFNAK